MTAEIDQIKEKILETVRAGSLGKRLKSVEVEPDVDDDDLPFLRVIIAMDYAGVKDDQLEDLLEQLEQAVIEVDHRHASVRFLDAA